MENELEKLAKLIRYYILFSTTNAGSGHVTSSLSAVEAMTVLFFKYFRYDLDNPDSHLNDHLIFSKGHASPLFYSLFAAAGRLDLKDLETYRGFNSMLEGHPTLRFAYTEAPTGSLGQGLSIGLGIALSAKYLDKHPCKVYVLLGDGEMAEGQIWEALQISSHYKLNNLIAVADINKLGQSGETILGHDILSLESRIKSLGWRTYVVENGHNLEQLDKAYQEATRWSNEGDAPVMILTKTTKGKGVSFLEGKGGWHGKALDEDDLSKALEEIGDVDTSLVGNIVKPEWGEIEHPEFVTADEVAFTNYPKEEKVATRKAYGNGLVRLGKKYSDVISMDADVKNSTFAEYFAQEFPERYFEMFIAEQNMVGAALGLSRKGKVPFVSTFAAFLTRAYDQIRMARLSEVHIVFCGSHAGVSIGQDGSSQMGLEDIAMMRTGLNTTVFYPSDAISTEKIMEIAYKEKGIVYIRTTRADTSILYSLKENFEIGGSKVLKESNDDSATVFAAGITLHEALKAYEELKKEGINLRVVDLYSIKPIDEKTILKAAKETKTIVTVEDHYKEGGVGDAVLEVLAEKGLNVPFYKLAVDKMPMSGKPEELLEYEGIDAGAIVKKVREVIK
jgi:transketolase